MGGIATRTADNDNQRRSQRGFEIHGDEAGDARASGRALIEKTARAEERAGRGSVPNAESVPRAGVKMPRVSARPSPTAGRIDPALDLEEEIARLKKERDAVILAHYYQESEIQDLADFVGDSLELARRGARAKEKVIAFAGVHFMAETSKILTPEKTVVVPDLTAGCSLADGCPAPLFAEWLKKYPGHTVVSYINCSAGVKALSDVIVTSS